MPMNRPVSIVPVKNTAQAADWVKQIAEIERLVQPQDAWDEQSVTKLLHQDINHGWVVITEAKLEDNGFSKQTSPQATPQTVTVAYCLVSTVFETAEILRIGTHPDFQRRGYAQSLIEQLIAQMPDKGLDSILLEVRADNEGAIRLYQKMGFDVIHTRKGYYTSSKPSGETERCDALIMQYTRA